MNDPPTHIISVRAIEDIIQIQKLIEDSPNLKSVQMGKNKSEEKVVFSVLKHDLYSNSANDRLNSLVRECKIENSFKCNDKTCKRLERNGWEDDCAFTKFVNPDVVVLENFDIIENTNSNADIKCWSSDSDITILRVKKTYRQELSNKVEWEEQRNLDDEESVSSTNLDWESHSLINLAGVTNSEQDVPESLTPFTIWSKTKNDTRHSSMIFMESLNSFTPYQPCTPEVRLTLENDNLKHEKNTKKRSFTGKKSFSNILRSAFSCILRRKTFE